MKLPSFWHKAYSIKCSADHVFDDCNDKVVQLEMNTTRADFKRLKYLEQKICNVDCKAALAFTKFHNDFSSLSFVNIFENFLSDDLTTADQPNDLSCDVADTF